MEQLFKNGKGFIPACDVSELEKLEDVAFATLQVPGIKALKIGLELVIPFGLIEAVRSVERVRHTYKLGLDVPIIYDHQKGGTDIPELGAKFAKAVKRSGADAIILFPFGGAKTEREWIKACEGEGLKVLVGGHMTQAEFLESEGGFIGDLSPERMFRIALELGVSDFILPGNKVPFVEKYRKIFQEYWSDGSYSISAPGFIKQGGIISEAGAVAGPVWNAIIGDKIYNAGRLTDMTAAAKMFTSQILAT